VEADVELNVDAAIEHDKSGHPSQSPVRKLWLSVHPNSAATKV